VREAPLILGLLRGVISGGTAAVAAAPSPGGGGGGGGSIGSSTNLIAATPIVGLAYSEELLGVPSKSTRLWISTLPPVSPADCYGGAPRAAGSKNSYLASFEKARLNQSFDASVVAPIASVGVAESLLLGRAGGADPSAIGGGGGGGVGVISHLPSTLLSTEQQNTLLRAADRYFDALCRALILETKSLRRLERLAELSRFSTISASTSSATVASEKAGELETARESQERLVSLVGAMGDVLDRELPFLPAVVEEEDGSGVKGGVTVWRPPTSSSSYAPFEDAFTYAFYRDVPNLRDGSIPSAIFAELDGAGGGAENTVIQDTSASSSLSELPPKVFRSGAVGVGGRPPEKMRGDLDSALKQFTGKDNSSSKGAVSTSNALKSNATGTGAGAATTTTTTTTTTSSSGSGGSDSQQPQTSTSLYEGVDEEKGGDSEYRPSPALSKFLEDAEFTQNPSSSSTFSSPSSSNLSPAEAAARNALGIRFSAMLDSLACAGSRETIDEWVREFLVGKMCTKNNRSRLLKRLFEAPSKLTDLYPFYARLTAVLETACKDFSKPLVALYEEEFRYLLRAKPNSFWDVKAKALRMLAELVKFGLASPGVLFRASKRALEEGSLGCLSLLCTLMECCGRFLYLLSPESNEAVLKLLEAMKRVRDVKCPRGPLSDAVEAAFFICVPAETAAVVRAKVRTPLISFIRYILFEYVAHSKNLDGALKTMRRLPWNDPAADVSSAVVKAAVSAALKNLDGRRLDLLVSLLSGLRFHHESMGVRLLDALQVKLICALRYGGRLKVEKIPPRAGESASQNGGETGGAAAPTTAVAPAVEVTPVDGNNGSSGSPSVSGPTGIALPTLLPAYRSKSAQMAHGSVRMILECYHYKFCDSSVIFRLLYSLVNQGHRVPIAAQQAALESVNSLILSSVTELPDPSFARGSSVQLPEPQTAASSSKGKAAKLEAVVEVDKEEEEEEEEENEGEEEKEEFEEEKVPLIQLPRFPIPFPTSDPCVGPLGFHPAVPYSFDPPASMLRIRLILLVLESAGHLFRVGSVSGAKMDDFLVFFLRYMAYKVNIPADLVYDVEEALAALRPSGIPALQPPRGGWDYSRDELEKVAGLLERRDAFAAAEFCGEAKLAALPSGNGASAYTPRLVSDMDEEDDDSEEDDEEEDDEEDEEEEEEAEEAEEEEEEEEEGEGEGDEKEVEGEEDIEESMVGVEFGEDGYEDEGGDHDEDAENEEREEEDEELCDDDDDDDDEVGEEEEEEEEEDDVNKNEVNGKPSSSSLPLTQESNSDPIRLIRPEKSALTLEEEEFERAFASIMSESLEVGRTASLSMRTGGGVGVNANMMGAILPSTLQGSGAAGGGGLPRTGNGSVVLTLLKRKSGSKGVGGGKIEAKTILVPQNVALATASSRAAATRAAEAEELKKCTMALHEASMMEEEAEKSKRGLGVKFRK